MRFSLFWLILLSGTNAFALTRTWDGGAVLNDNWADPDNWSGNLAPQSGDVLVFPTGIPFTDKGMDNNFPTDTTFRQLVFEDEIFIVRGNRFRLTHGIKSSPGVRVRLDTTVVLALDQTFSLAGPLELDLLDEIDTAGRTLTFTGGSDIGGKISGTGRVVIGSGADIGFRDNNDYTGETLVEAGGRLQLDENVNTPLGIGSGTTVAGTLYVKHEDDLVELAYELAEPLVMLPGSLLSSDGNSAETTKVTGGMELRGPGEVRIEQLHPQIRLNSAITGTGGLVTHGSSIVMDGTAANSFSGNTRVEAGLLTLEKASAGVDAIASPNLIIQGGAGVETRQDEQITNNCHVNLQASSSLRIGNITSRTETIGALTFGSGGTNPTVFGGSPNSKLNITGNITQIGTGRATIALDTRITAPQTLVEVAGSLQFNINASAITRSGSATLRKTGAGTLEFLSNQVSVPLQIAAGRVLFRAVNTQALFLDGGTLTGNGTASGGITSLAGGGIVQPFGEPLDTAVLTTGPLNLNAATTLQMQVLSTAAAGTGFDQISASGSVGPGGATLSLQYLAGFNVALGQSIVLLANDGTDAIVGTFAGLPQGAFIPVPAANGGNGWTISYQGGTGNDVALTRAVTPPVEVQPTVTTVTFGPPAANGNRSVTIVAQGTPGASYQLESSVNLTVWLPDGTAQTAAASNGAFTFFSTASGLRQFWRFTRQ